MTLFETERLTLRELTREDFAEFSLLFSDAEIMRYVGSNRPMTPPEIRRYFDICLSSYRKNGFGVWAVISKAEGRFIGCAGLEFLPESWDVEIFYMFKKAIWGQGFGFEAAQAVMRYGLDQCNLTEIYATIDPDNKPSIRIAEKLGMEYVRNDVDQHRLPIVVYRFKRPRITTGQLRADT